MNRLAAWFGSGECNEIPPSERFSTPCSEHDAASLSCGDAADAAPFHLVFPGQCVDRYRYPLLIWLHGEGSDEREVKQVLPLVCRQSYAAIAPRGTSEASVGPGFRWLPSAVSARKARDQVERCLEIARERLAIHSDRVFLVGRGEGGTMALRLGLAEPTRFAGVASLGGAMPRGAGVLRNWAAARNLPLYLSRGLESQTYASDRFCEDLVMVHAANLSVNAVQYERVGDELFSDMFRHLHQWMMGLVTGPSDRAQEAASPPRRVR